MPIAPPPGYATGWFCRLVIQKQNIIYTQKIPHKPVSLHLAEKHFPENHLPEKHFPELSFSRINICQKSHLPE